MKNLFGSSSCQGKTWQGYFSKSHTNMVFGTPGVLGAPLRFSYFSGLSLMAPRKELKARLFKISEKSIKRVPRLGAYVHGGIGAG